MIKKSIKKIIPSPLWSLLRFAKNNAHRYQEAKLYLKEYGVVETFKKIQKFQKKQLLLTPPLLTSTQKLRDIDFISQSKEDTDTNLKIAVIVHVFYLDRVEKILSYIANIPYSYSLYFTVSTENEAGLKEILQTQEFSYTITTLPNHGYDIVPFLASLSQIAPSKYDLVCKIHTKKGAANLEEHLEGIEDLWFDLLLNPLLGSKESVKRVVTAFEQDATLGMLSAATLLKSAQKWMYGNELYISQLIQLLDKSCDPAQEWGFNAGSIFWARVDIFKPLLKNYRQLETLLVKPQESMKTGNTASYFHAMERLFGLLPRMTQMHHGVSYAVDRDNKEHIIQILKNETPYASHLGVGFTLENEYRLQENYTYLLEHKGFDTTYYQKNTPIVHYLEMDPLLHFLRYGLYTNQKPTPDFSPFEYFNRYPHLLHNRINHFIDSLIIPKKKNFNTNTSSLQKEKKTLIQAELPQTNLKRVSLFAAYDKDGLVDESVLLFVKELSRHSDVYFLSDTNLRDGELDKLQPYTKGAWGIRHGEYDFGSYKRLAQYLVGWEILEQYDEVILVNDSSYLLKPLDAVFEKMNAKLCSWWGLQATKGMYHTQDNKLNQFQEKIPMQRVKSELLPLYAKDKEYDFHVASYFLVFRKPILRDGILQSLLKSVKKEMSKKEIILNYEVGLTKKLIESGYDFDTYMDDLYPFHPIYTDHIFEMIANGFPLFKRFFLTENHYKVPHLWRWEEKLLKLLPNLDLSPIKKNLYRVADAGKLYNNLHIEHPMRAMLSYKEFEKREKNTRVKKNCWIFPVCAYDHNLSGNDRAVFEEVKNNPNIKKVILIRSRHINVEGNNVTIVPLHSREGQEYLLESTVIFIKHSPRENTPYPLNPKKHKFINLWHGIPLKRIGMASLDLQDKQKLITTEHAKCHSVIASSSIDRMAMSAAFYPLTYNDIWVTGLPRNDFILKEKRQLPEDLQSEIKALEELLEGRKFILYAPTFRNAQAAAYYHFTVQQKEILTAYFQENNIVMGIREHMADKVHSYNKELKSSSVIDVGAKYFPNIEVLYRKADILITDYSSCFIDFMLTGKPMISFAYDYEEYSQHERGLFYDLEFAFAGNICQNFDTLFEEIQKWHQGEITMDEQSYKFKQKLFFDYLDAKSAKRLVEKIVEEDMKEAE